MKTKIQRKGPGTYVVTAWVGDIKARETVVVPDSELPMNSQLQAARRRCRHKVKKWLT